MVLGRRRRFLIDRLQFRLLGFNVFYFWALTLGMAALLFAPLMVTLLRDRPFAAQEQAAIELLGLHRRFWPAALIVFGCFVIHTVIVSHRIAGPLYRFRKTFAAVADGDLQVRATLRKHDYLTDEAAALNRMIAALEAKVQHADARVDALVSCVGELRTAADEVRLSDLRAGAARAERLAGAVRDALRAMRAARPPDVPGAQHDDVHGLATILDENP